MVTTKIKEEAVTKIKEKKKINTIEKIEKIIVPICAVFISTLFTWQGLHFEGQRHEKQLLHNYFETMRQILEDENKNNKESTYLEKSIIKASTTTALQALNDLKSKHYIVFFLRDAKIGFKERKHKEREHSVNDPKNLATEDFLDSLVGMNLHKVNLSQVDLSYAFLREADLVEATLNGAILSEADLSRAYLRGTNLRKAFMIGAHLTEADLRGADLHGANLTGANLTGADLRGADLRGANLTGADLRDVKINEKTKFDDKWR